MKNGLAEDPLTTHEHVPPRGEILALTGLRAVAALAVVVSHVGLPSSAPTWAAKIAQCGFVGVPLFFMLSGFVLAYNYPTLSPRSGWRKLTRFWVARIARVMPLYWVVLIWAVTMREVKGAAQDPSLPLHFFALQTWSGDLSVGAGVYNGPGWSICVEVFLYALFPFLVPLVALTARRWGVRGLLTIAAGAFAVQLVLWAGFVISGHADLPAVDPGSAHRWLYRNPLTRIPEFTVGMCLAFLLARGVRMPVRLASLTQAAVIVFVLVACGLRDLDSGPLGAAFFGTLWTIPFALLILSLASSRGFFAGFLSLRGMVMLGTASYALYLTHRGLLPAFGQEYVKSAPGHWGYAAVLVVIGLALVVAEGAHRYVEVPAREHVLRIADRFLKPRPAPTAEPPAEIERADEPEESEAVEPAGR